MPTRQFRAFLSKLLLLLFVLGAATPVFAIEPIKVALLPPLTTPASRTVQDTQIIQNTLAQPFKYPYYSLLPAATVQQTGKTYLTTNKASRLTDEQSLAQLADTLSVDLVVVVEVASFRLDDISSSWSDDTYIKSDIELNCYAYSSLLKRYDVIKVTKYDQEPESIDTNPETILKNLSEQILIKLPYKRIPLAGFEKPDLSKENQLPN